MTAATPSLLENLAKKLLRRKKNESWAMRRFENIRGLTSPTLGVGGNLYVHIAQHQNSGEHRPLACGVWRLAKHMLSGEPPESAREPRALLSSIRGITHLRAARLLCAASHADSFAERSADGVSRRFSDAFRYSAGSIACKRERDQFGAVGAETDPTRERRPA